MSTSKIGRTINPRDTVTPGYNTSKKESILESIKSELVNMKESYKVILNKYQEQQKIIESFREDIKSISKEKDRKLESLKVKLENKEENFVAINNKISDIENKLQELQDNCNDLKSKVSYKKKKESNWTLFRSNENGS